MRKKTLVSISTICVIAIIIILGNLIYSGFFSTSINIKVKAKAIDIYATDESVDFLTNSINDFSFNLYNELASKSDENIFFSPYSIFVTLAMAYEGARGDTANQMKNVLDFEQNNEISLCSFGRIYNLLNIDSDYTLNTANALWTKKGYPFLEDYLFFISNYYIGKAKDVDFTKSAETTEIINKWVEENTGGKIKNMLLSEDINPETVLILTNAIYFKGLWLKQFNVEDTEDRVFEITSDNIIQIPTMALLNSEMAFNYTQTEDLEIIELPYKGNSVSMIIILPKENNFNLVEKKLSRNNLSIWLDSMYQTNIDIYFPKFTLNSEYNLKEVLIKMGLYNLFNLNADFSGMNGFGNIYIEKILHKAFFEIKEEGAEAAAATTVQGVPSAIDEPRKIFNVDHPFIFLIQHKETDTILFIGKVTNPQ